MKPEQKRQLQRAFDVLADAETAVDEIDRLLRRFDTSVLSGDERETIRRMRDSVSQSSSYLIDLGLDLEESIMS